MEKGGLVGIGVILLFLVPLMTPAAALVINQFNATDDNYGVAFNESVIPATQPSVCQAVCTNYTVNITLENNLPVPGYVVAKFPVSDTTWFDVSGAVVVDVTSSASFTSWSYTVDQAEGEVRVRIENATPILAGNWINVSIRNVCNPKEMGLYQPTVYTTTATGGGVVESNDSVKVTIVPGAVKSFRIYYWNVTASKIESIIPDNVTQACCPSDNNPFYINVSAVDACGNLNTSWNFDANLSYTVGGGWTFLKTLIFANGWNNTSVCQPYTGQVQLKVENTTAGVSGTSNTFWAKPAKLGGFEFTPDPPKDPVYVTYPFDVTIKAKDACGNFKYDYSSSSDPLTDPFGFLSGKIPLKFLNGVNTTAVWVSSSACPLLDLYPYNLTVSNATNPAISATSENFTVTKIQVDSSKSSVTVDPNSVPADGTSYAVVHVYLKDPSGAPLVGVNVTLSSDRGSTDTIVPSYASTDSNGYAKFKVSSHTTGIATVTVKAWDGCNWVEVGTVQVEFTSQVANPGTSQIFVWDGTAWTKVADGNPDAVYANNASYYEIKVVARDNEGNPVENVNVTLFGSSSLRFEPEHALTNASGVAIIKVYSTEWGWFKINATANGQLIWEGPVEVYFEKWVGQVSVTLYVQGCGAPSYLCSPTNNESTDGVSELVAKVLVTDLSGKAVPGATVDVLSNLTIDNINCPEVTDDSGVAYCFISRSTSDNTTSNITARAKMDWQSWVDSSNYAYAYWQTNVTNVTNSKIWASKPEVIIDSDYAYVYVLINDSYNHSLDNIKVTLTTDRPDYDTIVGGMDDLLGSNSGSTAYDYTNCSGVAVFKVNSTMMGTSTFTAYVGSQKVGEVQITFAAPACGYFIEKWYADKYVLNLEEGDTATVYMKILHGYYVNDTDQSGWGGTWLNYTINLPAAIDGAKLKIRAYDVDYPDEQDAVYLNGVYLGNLTGSGGTWSITTFDIPPGVLKAGSNKISILVDPTGAWYLEVDYVGIVKGTPVVNQVVKVESLSNCGGNIVDVITPSNPVTNETGWITFTIRTDTAYRYYYGEGSNCNPNGEGNFVKLVLKIGECYLFDEQAGVTRNYDNPLDALSVIEHGPKEEPTLSLGCENMLDRDYPYVNYLYMQAPYYVGNDTYFTLDHFKLLLKNDDGTYDIWMDNIGVWLTCPSTNDIRNIYYEDFELSDGNWTASGTFSTWEWGEPLQSGMQNYAYTHEQDKGWATGLGQNYNKAENSCLYSPQIPINVSEFDPDGYLTAYFYEYDDVADGDTVKYEYTIDGTNWTTLYSGMYPPSSVNIPVSDLDNATFIQFRICLSADGNNEKSEGYYLDAFRLDYYKTLSTFCYGNASVYDLLLPWDEHTYNFTVKAVYCKPAPDAPAHKFCMEAPLSDVLTFRLDTKGPDIELAKSSFYCSEKPYGYFSDFIGVETNADDLPFYVNLQGFETPHYNDAYNVMDWYYHLPTPADAEILSDLFDNADATKFINVHFKYIELTPWPSYMQCKFECRDNSGNLTVWSECMDECLYYNEGESFIDMWSGDYNGWMATGDPWSDAPSGYYDVHVATVFYNWIDEFGYPYAYYPVWVDPGNNYPWFGDYYYGSVHGDLWFKFPVTSDEACYLTYEGDAYIHYHKPLTATSYGFKVDYITYGTGVKIYLWNETASAWEDITDQCVINEYGFELPQLEPGTYKLLVIATDKVGNANSLETTFTVQQCAARWQCSNLNVTPTTVVQGNNITVTATMTNVGEVADNYTAALIIDGEIVDTVTSPSPISPGESWDVSFEYPMNELGTFNVTVGSSAEACEDCCLPVQVTVVSPANITATYDVSPTELCVGDNITVNVTVTNTGGYPAPANLELVVDDNAVDSAELMLNPGDTAYYQFVYTMLDEGVHEVTVKVNGVPLPPTEVDVMGVALKFMNLLVSPLTGEAPLTVNVSVDVTNIGCKPGNATVDLKVDNEIVDTKVIYLNVGETKTVNFSYTLSESGVHVVTVDGLEGVEVNVTGTTVSEPWQNYDEDGSGTISDEELVNAIMDWLSGTISDEELINVILKWLS